MLRMSPRPLVFGPQMRESDGVPSCGASTSAAKGGMRRSMCHLVARPASERVEKSPRSSANVRNQSCKRKTVSWIPQATAELSSCVFSSEFAALTFIRTRIARGRPSTGRLSRGMERFISASRCTGYHEESYSPTTTSYTNNADLSSAACGGRDRPSSSLAGRTAPASPRECMAEDHRGDPTAPRSIVFWRPGDVGK